VADSKTYSSEVSDYLDAALARAEREKQWAVSRPHGGTQAVGEAVSLTVVDTLRDVLRRELFLYRSSLAVALLPLLVVGASVLLNAVGQGSFAGLPAPVALVGLALFLPWQAWQTIRRARGLPPRRLFGRSSGTIREDDLPPASSVGLPLAGGIAALPALIVLAWAISLPSFILWGLLALPAVLIALIIAAQSTLTALSAVGGVDTSNLDLNLGSPPASLAALDERIVRLTQMREWLRDDALRTMVDDVIGHHVQASERRQVIYSLIVGVVSLAAGWLLSAISPVSTLVSLFNR
jgi:hypothetical protein